MNAYVTEGSARATLEYRVRDADNRRLAREAQRHEQTAIERTTVPKTRRHSRLWTAVHFRHAYS
jgi:hypothetical protein